MATTTVNFYATRDIHSGLVSVGQRVYSGLYGGRYGIVIAIHGEQKPQTIGSICGVMSYGGNADFDIIFENGTMSRRLPESILRGVQWNIFSSVASADEILDAIEFERLTRLEAEYAKDQKNARQATEREQHLASNPHLLPCSKTDKYGRQLAAENIRRELKKQFPKFKFSVTQSRGSGINIRWTDGPSSDAVKAICDRHKAGHFDGMTDSYCNDNDNTFGDVFGASDYIFTEREVTLEGQKRAWEMAGNDPNDITERTRYNYDDNSYRLNEAIKKADLR